MENSINSNLSVMKSHSFLYTAFLILIILTSCNTKPEIGLLLANTEVERWSKDRDSFVKMVDELKGNVVVKDAQGDPDLQFQQALEMINGGIDVLVIIPADKIVAQGIVKMAKSSHIPVVAYDRIIRDCDLDFYVSADNIQVGELQAGYLTKIKPAGNYVLMTGPESDNNSYQLYLGWMDILQPLVDKGDVHVVYSGFTNKWDAKEGYRVMNELMQKDTTIDAVLTGADVLATGVINALRERDLDGTMLIAGQDADLNAVQNIAIGSQTMTVYKPLGKMAYYAAQAAIKLAKGKEPVYAVTVNNGQVQVPSVLVKGQVVYKENIKMTVVSEGFVTEKEIFE